MCFGFVGLKVHRLRFLVVVLAIMVCFSGLSVAIGLLWSFVGVLWCFQPLFVQDVNAHLGNALCTASFRTRGYRSPEACLVQCGLKRLRQGALNPKPLNPKPLIKPKCSLELENTHSF